MDPLQQQEAFPVKKFILFAVISVFVLVGWNYLNPPVPPQEETQTNKQNGEQDKGAQTETPPTPTPAAAPTPVVPPAREFPEQIDTLVVAGAEVSLTSKGGRLLKAEIVDPDRFSAAGNLLGDFPATSKYFPYAIRIDGGIIAIPEDYLFEVVESESQKTEKGYTKIVYRFTDPANRYVVDKIFETKPEMMYQYNLSLRVENRMPNTPLKETVTLHVVGYDDPDVEHSFLETRADRVESVCKLSDDLERKPFDKVEKTEHFEEESVWAAVDRRYFVFAAIPQNRGTQCTIQKVSDYYLQTSIRQAPLEIKPGESATINWLLFTGPKDLDILNKVGHDLNKTVDFGMFSFIAIPLRWLLVTIQSFVENWGLAIILLTVVVRLLLWPFNQMAYAQTEKMRRIQPKINEIKEKYKGDPQKIQEEQLRIMKESGTTPLGCLPMFLQFPILLGLYFMILNSAELYHADFILWYTNLSARDPYFVLPILMGVAMFLQQHFMTPPMDPNNPAASMQNVMKFMPILFTVFMLFLPSGVVLYYFVSLLIGLGQQWYIRESLAKKYAKLDAEENASS